MTAVVDIEKCVGCGACVELCPLHVIEMLEEVPAINETKCDGCGICVAACFTEAITMGAPAGTSAKRE